MPHMKKIELSRKKPMPLILHRLFYLLFHPPRFHLKLTTGRSPVHSKVG
jgi:hypothetical protein